ncbi:hypothetical protein HPC38_00320 [Pasteurellaceae bacterium HPA106]|uniref:hypothetical protein n=1 Tax=Spirabiliibacterium pneumoniae TaxID=221400 RepID=UPI001AAC8604|nr:hypothetical protein [Spirabiliibacterium pneumoniae]MBE2895329.1 hypothetical protein [Spirabiliibacterium pneumoniae]
MYTLSAQTSLETDEPLNANPVNGSYIDMMHDWVDAISQGSISVDSLPKQAVKISDQVGTDAYLYIGDYSVRLGKVRVGMGKKSDYRIAILGTSDKANLYSQTAVFNCRKREMRVVEVITYPNLSERMFYNVPKPAPWVAPKMGSGQYWLVNAICSANPVTLDDHRTVIGYSVQSNRLL